MILQFEFLRLYVGGAGPQTTPFLNYILQNLHGKFVQTMSEVQSALGLLADSKVRILRPVERWYVFC